MSYQCPNVSFVPYSLFLEKSSILKIKLSHLSIHLYLHTHTYLPTCKKWGIFSKSYLGIYKSSNHKFNYILMLGIDLISMRSFQLDDVSWISHHTLKLSNQLVVHYCRHLIQRLPLTSKLVEFGYSQFLFSRSFVLVTHPLRITHLCPNDNNCR